MSKRSEAARLLGSAKSKKKAAAARENGKKAKRHRCPKCKRGWRSTHHTTTCTEGKQ